MVSNSKKQVQFSKRIIPMIQFIKKCSQENNIPLEDFRKGMSDFCFNYPDSFKKDFFHKVGIKYEKEKNIDLSYKKEFTKFIDFLISRKEEPIFLLRDTYEAFKEYQSQTNKGIGVLINRKYISDDEEIYFKLIEIFYKSLLKSNNKNSFFMEYEKQFNLLMKNKKLKEKSEEISNYIENSITSKSIVWVDIGLNFTFGLFGYFSIKKFSKSKIKQDISLFSVYPWLNTIFENNFFSLNEEFVNPIEFDSVKVYEQEMIEKSQGSIVGFAIGDSLGFPVAGIDKSDIKNHFKKQLNCFEENNKHPYFKHLRKGQYTDNTKMLLVSSNNIIQNKGFSLNSYIEELKKWGQSIISESEVERWAGPTALSAVKNLINGKNHKNSGSKTTQSCSSTYRVIPLGITYRKTFKRIKSLSFEVGGITHNSNISKSGCFIVSQIIANLMNGFLPEQAVKSSINLNEKNENNKKLINNLNYVSRNYQKLSIASARKRFGTGSPIFQTLPLAVFCFLKYQNDFEKGILAAANSYRDDTKKEQERLKNLPYEKQMQECDGGNTDGIAGLTGAFLGAHLGINKIPQKFLKIENKNKLLKIGKELVRAPDTKD
ncbi:ADP-ribosylglycohydrolase family protein [Nanoarchaeota archaeon]